MSFFFSSRRRHTRFDCDWSSDVCSSDLARQAVTAFRQRAGTYGSRKALAREQAGLAGVELQRQQLEAERRTDESLLAALRDRDLSVSRKALQTALATPGVAASPSVTQLSTQLYQYERARDSLASRSTSHPDLPRLKIGRAHV